jgi:hypothetical protein
MNDLDLILIALLLALYSLAWVIDPNIFTNAFKLAISTGILNRLFLVVGGLFVILYILKIVRKMWY